MKALLPLDIVAEQKICDKGPIRALGIPELQEVLFVDGIKANLIKNSWIFYDKCLAKFTHEECTMFDNSEKVVVMGTRSRDNCSSVGSFPSILCNRTSLRIEELWHQRLDHDNYKMLKKLSKF